MSFNLLAGSFSLSSSSSLKTVRHNGFRCCRAALRREHARCSPVAAHSERQQAFGPDRGRCVVSENGARAQRSRDLCRRLLTCSLDARDAACSGTHSTCRTTFFGARECCVRCCCALCAPMRFAVSIYQQSMTIASLWRTTATRATVFSRACCALCKLHADTRSFLSPTRA